MKINNPLSLFPNGLIKLNVGEVWGIHHFHAQSYVCKPAI